MSVWRPPWWMYPERCQHGHEWGPGLIVVRWVACDCLPAIEARKGWEDTGHLAVYCLAAIGCRSVWYRPRHEPEGPELRLLCCLAQLRMNSRSYG
jgi:hypothetical protein